MKRLIQFKPKNKRQYRPAVLALLLVDRGLRIDEALTLRVEHVDFDNARPLDICGAQANVAGTCQGVPIRANQGGQSPCVNQCGDSVGLLVAVLLLEVARLGGRFGPAWLM